MIHVKWNFDLEQIEWGRVLKKSVQFSDHNFFTFFNDKNVHNLSTIFADDL